MRYLVAECITRSKPISTGRKFTGVAKVLSIIETSPCSRAKAGTDLRSGTCISGLVIDST